MKKLCIIIFLFVLFSSEVSSQSSLQEILSKIETNNKTLKAAKQSAQVQKIDAHTGIYPSDINVDYEYLFGNKSSDYQRESELTVSQGFDFPSAYFQKNKIAGLQSEQADIQFRIARQTILLEAKQLCIEIVYYNKMQSVLKHRLKNAEELNNSYQKKLQIGDANILEANKSGLDLLNVQTEYRLNEIEMENRLKKLSELNGGIPIVFNDTVYSETDIPLGFDDIMQKALFNNAELLNAEQEKKIAEKSVTLSKSMALPKISVGYKMSISNPEKFHGFVAGMSIPLWENKNSVKKAKAQSILADLEIEKIKLGQSNELRQLYDKMIMLKKSSNDYERLMNRQNNNTLLLKALTLGQISLLEYLTEVNFLYQSTENYLQTERDYHTTAALLMRYSL
ncbi:MAG: TolC family protein [Dysgonomonas sp.]